MMPEMQGKRIMQTLNLEKYFYSHHNEKTGSPCESRLPGKVGLNGLEPSTFTMSTSVKVNSL